MKIGILSMQMIDNYGSLLQAYGLKHVIESLENSVEFIDIEKIEKDYYLSRNENKVYADETDGKSKLKKLLDRGVIARLYNKKINKLFKKECKEFRRDQLDIYKKSKHYDLCVIGSDEVFNCLNSGWWGYTSQLFGNVPEADRIITYAASCGATKYENLPNAIKESIEKYIHNIVGFSVRDNNTYEFAKSFGIQGIENNLDPVLIYNFDEEVKRAKLPKLPEDYCVIYSYSYRFYKKEEVKAILDFCKVNQLTPITIQGGQTWCRKFIACDPFECLKIFENAKFVITDTFHGTIFSAKYADKFAVITRESNFNKLSDLVKRLGIEKHVIKDITQLDAVYQIKKDKDTISKILEEEAERTKNYLRKYI